MHPAPESFPTPDDMAKYFVDYQVTFTYGKKLTKKFILKSVKINDCNCVENYKHFESWFANKN